MFTGSLPRRGLRGAFFFLTFFFLGKAIRSFFDSPSSLVSWSSQLESLAPMLLLPATSSSSSELESKGTFLFPAAILSTLVST